MVLITEGQTTKVKTYPYFENHLKLILYNDFFLDSSLLFWSTSCCYFEQRIIFEMIFDEWFRKFRENHYKFSQNFQNNHLNPGIIIENHSRNYLRNHLEINCSFRNMNAAGIMDKKKQRKSPPKKKVEQTKRSFEYPRRILSIIHRKLYIMISPKSYKIKGNFAAITEIV